MAVATPKLRSAVQAAPAPSRTAPPEPKKRPRDRPRPGGRTTAPRKVRIDDPPRKPGRKPAHKKATARAATATAAPPRKAPARRKVAPKRRPASVIPIAAGHAGRAAVAVTQLPESGLIHRLTRGRAWIGVLGVLLVGIVALNVVTLSFAASSGKIDAKNTELSKENSMLQSRWAQKDGQARLRKEAGKLGLGMPTTAVPQLINAHAGDVREAAARLAAAATGAAAGATTGSAEEASGERVASPGGETASSGEEVASGEGSSSGEEAAAGSTGESEFTPEETAIYEREYEELLASEGVTEAPAG
ncbi:MAG TPA: hypothetical protein VGH14_19400 [Solirubrobacterales bacterium]|jgi:hypothetical protein